jgi:acyl-coenzyme A thioesterase PaaI-like protein
MTPEERVRASFARHEFKVNLLAPAEGERFLAQGRVVRAGRTLTVCRGDAVAFAGGEERHVATMTATMMAVGSRGGRQAG